MELALHLQNDFHAILEQYRVLLRKNQIVEAAKVWNTFLAQLEIKDNSLIPEYSNILENIMKSSKNIKLNESTDLVDVLIVPKFVRGTSQFFAILPTFKEAVIHLQKDMREHYPDAKISSSYTSQQKLQKSPSLHLNFKDSEIPNLGEILCYVKKHIGYIYFPERTWNMESGHPPYEKRENAFYKHKQKTFERDSFFYIDAWHHSEFIGIHLEIASQNNSDSSYTRYFRLENEY